MAKKIVRGITDVKTINNQDFDTNNVNDLLSDGQYNYIHRKKGKNEEYHNLTDNIKTLSSDNTELLSVTNYNKTTNTALLSPKHDAQKEQVLESTDQTITITPAVNGTDDKTNIAVNPKKVLLHEYLTGEQGITVSHLPDWYGTVLKISDDFVATVNGKQNKLTAGEGITIQGNTISATGASISIKKFPNNEFFAQKHVVTIEQQTLTTFSFMCSLAENVITGELKQDLEKFVRANGAVSNGALTISNDGTNMKLTNSAPSQTVFQQASFTFQGGGSVKPVV